MSVRQDMKVEISCSSGDVDPNGFVSFGSTSEVFAGVVLLPLCPLIADIKCSKTVFTTKMSASPPDSGRYWGVLIESGSSQKQPIRGI